MKNTIGNRIASSRKAAGHVVGAQFARDVGVQTTTLWRYETNRLKPGVDVLARIAVLCGVSMEWLATGRDVETCPIGAA